MSNSKYIKIIGIDQFVNQMAAGDPTAATSNIQFELIVPNDVIVGENLLLSFTGPADPTHIVHKITNDDLQNGLISISIPNANLIDAAQAFIEGGYSITLSVFTQGGGISHYPGEATFTLDTIPTSPPQIAIENDTGSANNDLVTNDAALKVVANEAASSIEYSSDGGTTWGATAPIAVEGDNSLQVREIDEAGNPSLPATLNFILDTSPPDVTIEAGITNQNSPLLTGTVDDVDAVVVVTLSGKDYQAVNNGDGTWAIAQGVIDDLQQGETVIAVTATDVAGNESNATATVTLDSINPDIEDQSLDYNENQIVGAVIATVSASDDIAVVDYQFVHQNNTRHSTSEDGFFTINSSGEVAITAAGVASEVNDFELGDTAHSYSVIAVDSAGNSDTATMTLTEKNIHEGITLVTVNDVEAIEGGQALFIIDITNAAQNAVVTFDFTDDSATENVDYKKDLYEYSLDNGATWTAVPADEKINLDTEGDYSIQVRMDIVADNLNETMESFTFDISVHNPNVVTPIVASSMVNITDNSVTARDDGSQSSILLNETNSSTEERNITNTYALNESNSDVTGLQDGGYVVAWQANDSSGNGIYTQKYDVDGNKIDGAYLINTNQQGNQREPNVTGLENGKYLVTWIDSSTNPASIRGQLMDGNNQFKVGDEFIIGDEEFIRPPVVRYDPIIGLDDGGFIVTWSSNAAGGDDASGFGVYGLRFDADANQLNGLFLINQTTRGNQLDSDVAIVDGNLVVSWSGNDDNGRGVYSRTFSIEDNIDTITDDFENGDTNGWINASVTDGANVASQFLGRFGRGESTSKTYDFGSENAGKQVEISFDFLEIDTWDWEEFLVFVNGVEVSSNRHHSRANEAGSSALGQIEGTGSTVDSKVAYSFKARLDDDGQFTLGFGSTLNESIDNESFGIDNIVISTSSISPTGDEKSVNTTIKYDQDEASITSLSDEGYVISWTSYGQDGNCDAVYLQKFDNDGNKVGEEAQVNTIYTGNQNDSNITSLPDGGYVVTWSSYGQDGSYDGVYAQRFAADGATRGAEVQVSDTAYHHQNQTSIDTLEDDGYVISWTGYNNETKSYDIFTKRYTSDGSEFKQALAVEDKKITQSYSASESNSEVAGLEDGGYVVVWQGKDSASNGIYSQKYDANGAKIEGAYLINELQTGQQTEPRVADLGNAKYLVTWTDASTNPTSIRGQIMDADNQFKIGDEFVVADKQAVRYDPLVGLEDGGFVVTWTSNIAGQEDNSGFGVYGQRFDSDAIKIGNKFLINETISGNQEDSDVALVNGNLVVTWTAADAHGKGVYTREFSIENDVDTITDNFEDGSATGWSSGIVTDGLAVASQFLGQFGRGQSTSKTYDFGSENAGKQVDIRFDFLEIDTWDGEQFLVFIDGQEVSSNKHYHRVNESGSVEIGQITGTAATKDEKIEYTFKTLLDDEGKFTLGFGSTLNESIDNESFGIDNIVISTSGVSPVTDERLVNTVTTHNQDESSITALSDEGYVISWTSYAQDGNCDAVYLQKFDKDGEKVGEESQVNTIFTGNQNDSNVTSLVDGGFVVTWTSYAQDGSYDGIFAQRFATDGSTLGAEVRVNTTTFHHQNQPSIDSLEDGGYVISWTSYSAKTASYDIFAKRYTKEGNEFKEISEVEERNVSDSYAINESNSDVAGLVDGGYVVVWQGKDSAGTGIYSQKYDVDGKKIDDAFLINTLQSGNQSAPNVADLGEGKYLVTWTDASTNPTSLRGQIMDSNNQFKIGDELIIADQQAIRYDPIVGLEDGGFIVTWTSNVSTEDNSGFGVNGLRFNAQGQAVGNMFLINQTTSGNQEDSDVALVDGNLVVSWTGNDTNGRGVFVREFSIENNITTLTDNFEDGDVNGWSNATVTDGGTVASQFLGQFGRGESTSKTYSFGSENAGKQVDISFDFLEIDTWDGEQFLVFINGTQVSNAQHYYWRTEANSEVIGQIEGTHSKKESKTSYTFKALLDDDGEFTLGFGASLNENIDNESFGIDNISISTSGLSPIGDETAVNTTARYNQDESSITALSNEGYVISWTTYAQDGHCDAVYLQKFDNDGNKVGEEQQVNTIYTGNQNDSSISSLPDGGYVVTWTSYGQDGSYDGIYVQRFANDGSKLGAETQVNDTTYHHQNQPSIDSLEDGGYIISWTGYNAANASYDIYTKRYTKDGNEMYEALITSEEQVSNTYSISEANSDVASLEDGGYVIVWQAKDSNGTGIYSQKYDANNIAVDDAYLINSAQKGNQTEPNVADLGDGKYLVTWTDATTNPTSIRGQLMDADNQFKVGDEFVIADKQAVRFDPLVGLEDGGFIITWTSNVNGEEDNSGFGVYGLRFNADAEQIGNIFLINQTTTGNQEDSEVALVDGNLIVSWTGVDNHGKGIFTREFSLENNITTITDDFEDGSLNDWQNTSITDGGAVASQFLGKLGRGQSTSKEYDFGDENAGKQVDISFDFIEIDTWDGEEFLVFIDGVEVSDEKHYHYRSEADSVVIGQIEGTASKVDSKTSYTFKTILDDEGKFTLGFGSTLNESTDNESFGIDNISISTSGVSPVGDEKLVNSTQTHTQDESSITATTDGGYVVTWTTYHQDANGSEGIYLQKYDADGEMLGTETQINTFYTGNQSDSAITALNNGGYVVTWASAGQDGSYDGVFAQRFNADGDKRGAEVKVNDTTYHHQNQPSIDTLEDGGYVISWTGYNKDNASMDIYAKRYNEDGTEFSNVSGLNVETNTDFTLDVSALLENDFDAQGDDFSIKSVQAATNGTVEIIILSSGEKQVLFKPENDFEGKASFTYTIEDIHGATDTATVYLNVVTNRSTPLVLDLDGDGVETLSIDDGVSFDINNDGITDRTGWVGKDDALLVLDKNNDGVINNASELFGEESLNKDGSKAEDGFSALRDLDSNNDGKFDAADEQYSKTQIWQDENSDGVSQAQELAFLADAGVESIDLSYNVVDENSEGNKIGLRSSWTNSSGEKLDTDDVWFTYKAGKSNILDLSDLLSENVQMDSLDQYLHFEQEGDDLLVYIDENGGFTEQAFDVNNATGVFKLDNVTTYSMEHDDVLKLLIDNNHIIVE